MCISAIPVVHPVGFSPGRSPAKRRWAPNGSRRFAAFQTSSYFRIACKPRVMALSVVLAARRALNECLYDELQLWGRTLRSRFKGALPGTSVAVAQSWPVSDIVLHTLVKSTVGILWRIELPWVVRPKGQIATNDLCRQLPGPLRSWSSPRQGGFLLSQCCRAAANGQRRLPPPAPAAPRT